LGISGGGSTYIPRVLPLGPSPSPAIFQAETEDAFGRAEVREVRAGFSEDHVYAYDELNAALREDDER